MLVSEVARREYQRDRWRDRYHSDPAFRVKERERARAIQQRLRAEKAQYVREYKLKKGCTDCGYRGHYAALDLDHVIGEKAFSIATVRNKSWARLLAELAKCEVRCANCHRIKTFGQKPWEASVVGQ